MLRLRFWSLPNPRTACPHAPSPGHACRRLHEPACVAPRRLPVCLLSWAQGKSVAAHAQHTRPATGSPAESAAAGPSSGCHAALRASARGRMQPGSMPPMWRPGSSQAFLPPLLAWRCTSAPFHPISSQLRPELRCPTWGLGPLSLPPSADTAGSGAPPARSCAPCGPPPLPPQQTSKTSNL